MSEYEHLASTHVYVCAAILTTLSPELIHLDHAEFVVKIQSIGPDFWTIDQLEMILAQAYVYEKTFSYSSF